MIQKIIFAATPPRSFSWTGQEKVEQLLATKFFIPKNRLEHVSRQRLIERFNQGVHCKLTLISAPAGFGKTTLISEWVGGLQSSPPTGDKTQIHVAWLSVDQNDNDPVRFLSYIIAALRQANGIDEKFAKGMLDILKGPQPPPTESILNSLINEIADNPDKIIFILDDYHYIGSSVVNDALSFLLEYQPPNFHLVIATREDLQLPLARLRAGGQLNELRSAELRFTSSEAAEFLNTEMGLGLSEEDVVSLENRTEGWIVGLQLAAISMQGREDTSDLIKAFTGSHRFVLDYLIEEVLEQQPEDVQNFLLRSAILDRMQGSLCNALTGQEDGEATLETLEHANLFIIPLDEERRWYRFHHLFSDLLRVRLRRTKPEEEPALHLRASKWYEGNGFFDEAIEHAYRANDIKRVVDLVEKNSEAMWRSGEHAKFRRWMSKVPEELIISNPNLCILSAGNLSVRGRLDESEKTLDRLPFSDTVPPNKKEKPKATHDNRTIQGRAAAIRAFIASHRGDTSNCITHAQKALEYLPKVDLSWRSAAAIALGDAYSFNRETEKSYQTMLEAYELSKAADQIYLNLIASIKLAVTMRNMGKLHQAIELCEKQMELTKEHGMSHMAAVGFLLATWAETLAEINDLDYAIDRITKGVERTERSTDVAMRSWAYLCMLRIFFSRGEMDKFEELINKIDKFSRENHVPPSISNIVEAMRARSWLRQGKLDFASKWVEEHDLDIERVPHPNEEHKYLAFARILSAQGQLDEAIRLLDRMLGFAEEQKYTARVIKILIIKALALQKSGQTDEATALLKRALTIAEPLGFFRSFVDEGPPMAQLLYQALDNGITPEYISRLLAAFPLETPKQTDPSKLHRQATSLIEPLTNRETEVLILIAKGLTNQEIASRLFLSLNTVKVHTRNIFQKLSVNNRTEAVARAKGIGILPPD